MRDTDEMELYDRREERGPVPAEEQMAVLRRLGLDIPDPEIEQASPEYAYLPILLSLGTRGYRRVDGVRTRQPSQVFSFDMEADDAEEMYRDYFLGLQSLSEGELAFTDLTVDLSQVDWEGPGGVVDVCCAINGTPFQYSAAFQGDWLDMDIQAAVNGCLEALGSEKRFFATSDGGQYVTVFFCTEEWARAFEEATLCHMS